MTGTTAGDDEQPTVTIYLEAQDVNDDSKTYYLQTTVTQRILDMIFINKNKVAFR